MHRILRPAVLLGVVATAGSALAIVGTPPAQAGADFGNVVGCVSIEPGIYRCSDSRGNVWYTDRPGWRYNPV